MCLKTSSLMRLVMSFSGATTGQYVQHCHILAHEDCGMMQLLEVVTNKTITKHY